jgi:hypothetical protein
VSPSWLGCESDGYHQKSLKLETSYHATPISSPLANSGQRK